MQVLFQIVKKHRFFTRWQAFEKGSDPVKLVDLRSRRVRIGTQGAADERFCRISDFFDSLKKHLHKQVLFYGAPKMIRTSDTRFRKPLLYPLSYKGVSRPLLRPYFFF